MATSKPRSKPLPKIVRPPDADAWVSAMDSEPQSVPQAAKVTSSSSSQSIEAVPARTTRKFTVEVPQSLYRRLRMHAIDSETKVQDVLFTALAEFADSRSL